MNIASTFRNCLLVSFSLFIFLLPVPSEGAGDALFRDAPPSADLYMEDERPLMDRTVLRLRHVEVNFDALVGKDFPEGAAEIGLNLYDDVSLKGVKDRLERRSDGSYTWFGLIEGAELSQVVLTVEDGVMAGNIAVNGKFYQIRYVGDGVYDIYEIDQSAFPEELPPIPVEMPYDLDLTPDTAADDGSTIDIMVVYTADVAAASSDINAEIQLAIDETNQSYANSGIAQRVRLVHSSQVTYTETGNISTDLNRLQNTSDASLDTVHTLRDTFGADLVSLWVEDGGGCGTAYFMASVGHWFEAWAFSVVDRGCATGYYTFGHELGHNMSARHDWYIDDTNNSPYTYNHGYVNTAGQWRTIMAYNTECSDGGFNCTRVPYWSNPDVSTGVAEGTDTSCTEDNLSNPDCDADNRKTLNNTAYTVANFRTSVVIEPDVVATVSTDASSDTTGDTMTLYVSLSNNGAETTVDIYLVLMLPDGSIYFLEYYVNTGGFSAHPGTLDPLTWTPLVKSVTLPAGFTLTNHPFLQLSFGGSEPVGNYIWAIALMTPGTTDIVGEIGSAGFTFTP